MIIQSIGLEDVSTLDFFFTESEAQVLMQASWP